MEQIKQFAVCQPGDPGRVALIRTDWPGTVQQLIDALSRAVTAWIDAMPCRKEWLDAESGVTIEAISDYLPGCLISGNRLGQALRSEGIIYLEIQWVDTFDAANLDEPALSTVNLYQGENQ